MRRVRQQRERQGTGPRPSRLYRLVSITGAFVFWGGWSAWVNLTHGLGVALRSGLVQAVASALMTVFVIESVAWWFEMLPRARLTFPLPAAFTIAGSGAVLAAAHWMAGTPRILATVWLPLSLGLLYALVTTWRLARSESPRSG